VVFELHNDGIFTRRIRNVKDIIVKINFVWVCGDHHLEIVDTRQALVFGGNALK
jgi:uncharacterized protein (DUF2252 family)